MKLVAMKHDMIVAETLDEIRMLAVMAGLTTVGDGVMFGGIITIHDDANGEVELLHYGEESLMVSDTAHEQTWTVIDIEEVALDFDILEEKDVEGFVG